MKIVSPPPFPDQKHLQKILGRMLKKNLVPSLTDSKGRYLHWDKLRYLNFPEGFDNIEDYWYFLKFSRSAYYKRISCGEQIFRYALPDMIQESLHEIDSRIRGSVEAEYIGYDKIHHIKRALGDEAISSSQIEGASTTRQVAREMLSSKRPPKNHSEQMIYNNYQAIQFIEQQEEGLTVGMILELHRIITNDTLENPADCGRTRRDNNIKVYDNRTQAVLHNPPDYQILRKALDDICDFANGKTPDYFIHPVIRAIVVHFLIGFYHPFVDGNGRTARVLFYWIMLKNNYWLFEYITLSTYIHKAVAQYGKSFLMSETDDNDLTYFIISQFKFIHQAIEGLLLYMDKKQKQVHSAGRLLGAYLRDGRLKPRQAMLIQHAVKHPGEIYTIARHQASHGISYETAKNDLLKLARLGFLQQSKRGRAFVFIAPADIETRINENKRK